MSGPTMNLTSLRPMSRMRLIAAGFGLIELMIGILIGTLLLLGLTQVFSTTRNAYQTSEGVARAQESSRFAMDFLSRDLRMAGHEGCTADVAHFQSNPPDFYSHFLSVANRTAQNWTAAPYGEQFNASLQGYEATNSGPGNSLNISTNADPVPFGSAGAWTPALPAEVAANGAGGVVVGSDVVTIRTFDTTGIPVTAINVSTNPATITVPAAYSSLITANNLYGIADCNKVSVFQATTSAAGGVFTVGVGGLNQSGFVGENWATGNRGMYLYPLRSVVYFVGRATNGGPALYRINYSNGCGPTTFACVPEELVDGIENMQFLYGYDNHGNLPDGAIDTYWTAAQVVNLGGAGVGSADAAWRRIGTVRLGFISRSIDQAQTTKSLVTGGQPSNVVGTLVSTPDFNAGSNDSRLRIVYTNTVSLRNQLYGN